MAQGARQGGPISEAMVGAVAYVLILLAVAGLLIAFPQIALFLPGAVR